MATQGTVFTPHFEIEPRQHELLGLDLGEGPPRRALILGALGLVLWAVPLVVIFGWPNQNTTTFYILPPALVIAFGLSKSGRMRRRIRLTEWALAIRYALTSRPVIRYGARRATTSEQLPVKERWSFLTRATQRLVPTGTTPPWEAPGKAGASAAHKQTPNGRTLHLHPRSNVIGAETLLARLQSYTSRKRTPK